MVHDLKSAWRAIVQAPIVTCAAVLSLALGIGANTALFTVVNSLLLRSLPVPEPQRLVTVSSAYAIGYGFKAGAGVNYDIWTRMNDRLQLFDSGFAWVPARVDLSQGGERQLADALFVTGGFFQTLRVQPLLGRTVSAADDVRGGGPNGLVAVISYGLWQRRFDGAADVVGRSLPIEGVPCTIVGVTAPEFFGVEVGQPFDVVLPLGIEPQIRGNGPSLLDPRALMLTIMLRLKLDQSVDSATAMLRAMQPDILGLTASGARDIPAFVQEPFVLVPAATGTSDRSGLRRRYTGPLLTILAVVALVLLVACVNIANLLIARASARRHEMGIRLALGASRWHLARQLFVESLVLSALGALAGLLFATWGSRALIASLSTSYNPVRLDLPLDWRVLAVTALIALTTAMVFGTAAALHAVRTPSAFVLQSAASVGRGRAGSGPIHALNELGRVGTGSGISGMLVVLQVALSMVLVIAAGLFVSTFQRLARASLGFDSDRILVIDIDTARANVDNAARNAYFQQLVDVVKAVPGVSHAVASHVTPFSAATRSPMFDQADRIHPLAVTPGFFSTYGVRVRAGRDFDERDGANSQRVAIVSEAYIRKFFPNGEPVGATLDSRLGCAGCTVIGTVADAVFASARSGPRPALYVPLAQSAGLVLPGKTTVSLSVRSSTGSPAQLTRSVAEALAATNGRLAFSFRPLQDDVDAALTQERVVAMLSGFFGGLALLLSAIGLYGLTSYAVTRRRKEIGIRVALGATPSSVVMLVMARLFGLVVLGLSVGAALSVWASKLVAALLYGLEPGDPTTIGIAALVLLAVAVVASSPSAFRAARVDPAEVLRQT